MDFPVIISFYTEGTPYQIEVLRLIESCEKYDLEYQIEGIPSFGAWELNCGYKPFFILKKLEELNRPLLWVDADGMFVKRPIWQEAFGGDLAVRINPELRDTDPSKVISSTVFVKNSSRSKELLQRWIYYSQKIFTDKNRAVEFWDQVALREVILENADGIRSMPLSYAKIFDSQKDHDEAPDPVIEHYQASRRFKDLL